MFGDEVLHQLVKEFKNYMFRELNKLKIPYKLLINTPSEFSLDYISDPTNYLKYRYFLRMKSIYKEPIAKILLYILERFYGVKVREIYYHDLIGGTPPILSGVAGRDIDYFVVVDKPIDYAEVKKVESFLDELVASTISEFYKSRGVNAVEFNRAVGHNLIEVHLITEDEKGKYNLDSGNIDVPVEKADLEKFRFEINSLKKNFQLVRERIPT